MLFCSLSWQRTLRLSTQLQIFLVLGPLVLGVLRASHVNVQFYCFCWIGTKQFIFELQNWEPYGLVQKSYQLHIMRVRIFCFLVGTHMASA